MHNSRRQNILFEMSSSDSLNLYLNLSRATNKPESGSARGVRGRGLMYALCGCGGFHTKGWVGGSDPPNKSSIDKGSDSFPHKIVALFEIRLDLACSWKLTGEELVSIAQSDHWLEVNPRAVPPNRWENPP
ncbi:MAG: hypothetical protein AOA65_1467 [Candidatus Bathyarchaeota archaeon BA1]|nr:MAG: hypothetical protein AOA65_1467 [Candidatus Bathyarchaeota archaeon BA1]